MKQSYIIPTIMRKPTYTTETAMMLVVARTVGKRIRELREESLLTQEELATKASLNPNSIVRIETGTVARPRFSTIRKIAAALEVDPRELTKGLSKGE